MYVENTLLKNKICNYSSSNVINTYILYKTGEHRNAIL